MTKQLLKYNYRDIIASQMYEEKKHILDDNILLPSNTVDLSLIEKPLLHIVIDTEEEFDWNAHFTRVSSTENINCQQLAMDIFAQYKMKPLFAVDYPVVHDDKSCHILKYYIDNDLADIGTHLHPWVTPPFTEMLNRNNSFPCNLPHQLEKEKLYNTTKLITEKLKKPICYKAGRYGIGKNTPTILKEYGYKIDLSVFPTRSFKNREGPDFKKFPTNPFWLDEQKTLLELPMSAGYTGFLKSQGSWISSILENSLAKKAYLPAILARLKLFDHITLTPEGMTLEEAILLTKTLYESGTRIFTFSYHSSSLQIGQTPYVRDKEDLKIFLQRIKDYLKFFQDFGGDFTTAENLYEALKK